MSSRAKMEFKLLATVLRLPAPLLSLFAGKPIVREGNRLDVHCQALLKMMELSKQPTLEQGGAVAGRRYMDKRSPALSGEARALPRVEDRVISTPNAQIPVRIYAPIVGGTLPALVFFHGGGFVLGSITSHDRLCRIIAAEANCVVINVEYRCAPEHPFPAAADDALAAFRWVRDNAEELGVIAERIAVGGDSAGGNLAAGLCYACVQSGEAAPCYQWLVYPVTDVTKESKSYVMFEEGFYLTRAAMKWFTDCYLLADVDRADARVSPLLAKSLATMPPAWVMTAGFDPLRDEGAAYAQKLSADGVAATHRNYPGLFHGVFSMTGVIPAARAALQDGIVDLRRYLRG